MARRKQEGNRFFRLDVDFFSDKKIKILKARYGADGITLYMYLLCVFRMFYKQNMTWKAIAKQIGMPHNEDYPRVCIRDAYLKKMKIM